MKAKKQMGFGVWEVIEEIFYDREGNPYEKAIILTNGDIKFCLIGTTKNSTLEGICKKLNSSMTDAEIEAYKSSTGERLL